MRASARITQLLRTMLAKENTVEEMTCVQCIYSEEEGMNKMLWTMDYTYVNTQWYDVLNAQALSYIYSLYM